MKTQNTFYEVYAALRKILKTHEKSLKVMSDSDKYYSLYGPYSERFKKDLWFGGVEIKKNYVSFHLMPVYMYKDLSENIPANLKKRMQGKSCFNFKKVDMELLGELKSFTELCYKEFKKRGDDIIAKD